MDAREAPRLQRESPAGEGGVDAGADLEPRRLVRGIGRLKLALVFLGLLLFRSICVWDAQFSDHDGPRVAGIAREMGLTGDFFIPRLNGEPFLEYPSLGYLPY